MKKVLGGDGSCSSGLTDYSYKCSNGNSAGAADVMPVIHIGMVLVMYHPVPLGRLGDVNTISKVT